MSMLKKFSRAVLGKGKSTLEREQVINNSKMSIAQKEAHIRMMGNKTLKSIEKAVKRKELENKEVNKLILKTEDEHNMSVLESRLSKLRIRDLESRLSKLRSGGFKKSRKIKSKKTTTRKKHARL